jgi:hypothetical protein
MNKVLDELMWDAHRAESDAALLSGYTGDVTDPREEEHVTIAPDEASGRLEEIHNLGVANGIKAFLTQLSEQGYVLTDSKGETVPLDGHKDLGAAWAAWFKTPQNKVGQ